MFIFLIISVKTAQICDGIILDAGSSSTKAYVYSWDCRSSQSYPKIDTSQQPPSQKVSPGISAQRTDQVSTYLAPILTFAGTNVPAAQKKYTPIFLGATAGMRLLTINTQNAIIDQVRTVLNSSGYVFETPSWARVISGQEEAAYLWLSVNFLLNNTGTATTVATIDLGGASTQIAFQTTYQGYNSNMMLITLPNMNYSIFAISYIGYGNDQARIAVVTYSISGSSATTPCYPNGFSSQWSDNKAIFLTGTGDLAQCMNLISTYLNSNCYNLNDSLCGVQGIPQPSLPANMTLYAVSGVQTMAAFFNLTNFTLNDYYTQLQSFWSLSWSQIQAVPAYQSNSFISSNFFFSAYVYQLLVLGYNIPLNQTIYAPATINNYTPTWSIAGLQYQLSQVGCVMDSPICTGAYIFQIALIILSTM